MSTTTRPVARDNVSRSGRERQRDSPETLYQLMLTQPE